MKTGTKWKYLYGKRELLENLIHGGVIRFTDIVKYGRLDNVDMRDEETLKRFILDKNSLRIRHHKAPGIQWLPTEHVEVFVRTPRAYCLCLSNHGRDPKLFERFSADVCIEINSELLVDILASGFGVDSGVKVASNDVNYYPPIMRAPDLNLANSIFYKPERFWPEDEYRVVLQLPTGHTFMSHDGQLETVYSNVKGREQHVYIRDGSHRWVGKVHSR